MITKNNIVIASNSLNEAITKSIIKNKKNLQNDISIVLLQDLVYDYEISDELSDTSKVINWYNKKHGCISNKSHILLNRVLYFPKSIFAHFTHGDREYAKREFEAYIGFAFNAFTGVGNKTTQGICENIMPLPWQWRKIKKECRISIPNYYWGPSHMSPLHEKKSLVYSSIYNFLNWSPMSFAEDKEHIFCFEKPQGEPVFIFSIGSQQLVTSEICLSKTMKDNIHALVRQIHNAMNYFISEILIFVDDLTVTFGCINAEVVRSSKHSKFDEFVSKNVINEFYKCIN